MPYIQNNKYKEIYQQSRDGNEKAMAIIQALRNGAAQKDLDGLINDYYLPQTSEEAMEMIEQPEMEAPIPEELTPEVPNLEEEVAPVQEMDLTPTLDAETEGLFDENEIEDTSFSDFLADKAKNANRARKNAEYFKSFDPEQRTAYMNNKIGSYKDKFNGQLKNIERKYNDMAISLDAYSKKAALLLDDDVNLDMNKTAECYDNLIQDKNAMSSLGRFWDENDNQVMSDKLSSLHDEYGKQNLIAALNTLKNDNETYRNFSNNKIDQEISRYSKSVSDLLK